MEEQAGVVDSPQQTELNLADVSTDDLRQAMLTQPEAVEEAPAQPEEESQTEPEPEATTTEEVSSDEPVEEVFGETEEERLAKRRIRPKNELDQQVIDLYRSEGFSGTFADAASVIYGQTSQPNQPQPQPVQPEPIGPDPFTTEAGKLNGEIQDLEIKVKEAAEDLDTLQALNLQREIMKRELQLQSLNDRKERESERIQEAQYNTHRNKAVESRERAYEAYPELSDKSTIYRKEFDHFINQAQEHSDYAAIFNSPNWPELMANDFAARKGVNRPAPAAPEPVQQKQVQPLGSQAKVLTTGQAAQPVQQPQTAESIINNLGDISNDQLFEMLGTPDGRSFLR
jgi:hypothetical protein